MRIIMQAFVLVLILFERQAFARDHTLVHFIKSYVQNEEKPTILIMNNLCWEKKVMVRLANEMSKIGSRSSTSMGVDSRYYYHDFLYLLDLDCPGAEDIIALATARNLFRSPYRWLVITAWSKNANIAALWNSPVLADSDLVLAAGSGGVLKLVELHKPSPNGTMISTLRGFYNGSLYDVRPHRELFRRRRDVMGHTITMSNVIQDSNTTVYHLPREDGMEPQYDSISKICWMNVKLAFQMLNATPGYVFSYRWGYKVNGKWSGMIDDIHSGRAELGTNCVVSDIERLDVVAYTDRLAPFRVRFVFRQPPLPYVANIFSMPFSKNVWIAMSVCAVLSTVTVYLAAKWEAKEGKGPTQLDSIGDAMLLTFSAIGQQGCVMEPRRLSGRMMVFVLFTALMALYAAYSANIVVLLQAPSDSIRSLPQLANAKITLAANDVDYNHFVFKLHKDPVREIVYKRIDPEKGKKHFYDLNEGVERIRQGLFAFHSIVEPVYMRIEQTFLETEKCDLMEVDFLNSYDSFVPVRKESPYLELLRVVFKQIRESGIQSALSKRLQVPKPHCTSKMSSFSSVGLMDMKPVLILMLYGVCLSVTIAAAEILVFKLSEHRKKYKVEATDDLPSP
ncbi:glutamate receptor 1-like [Helicoverpa zea]|uniref:glutamate receptor 1-like n=1 Tax=Helicoverpa zea TaxID=7113 RepID=UPI001F5AFEAD|nr:glutamate receptor 1-like [Helicoverpa zea]